MLNTHQGSRTRLFAGLALLALLTFAAALVAPPTRADAGAASASAQKTSGEIVPIVRINPRYPREAAENRVEGFVKADPTRKK